MKAARTIAALAACLCASLALASSASAAFSIEDFEASSTTSVAGGHPDIRTNLVFATKATPAGRVTDGNVRTLAVKLPPGMVGDPTEAGQCSQSQFAQSECSPDSQIGTVKLSLIAPNPEGGPPINVRLPAFNLTPRNDETTAELAFSFAGFITIHLPIAVRTDSDYGLTVLDTGVNRNLFVASVDLTTWGVPGDPSHDSLRENMRGEVISSGQLPREPFFTNPTKCGGPLELEAEATAYPNTSPVFAEDTLPPITGCDEVDFEPSLEARPTTNIADSPSGLELDLGMPQNEDPDEIATAQLRDAEVTLPDGLVVNPASANGLGSCSPEEIGLTSPVNEPDVSFTASAPNCPSNSAIGTVEVQTPVFEEPLEGRVFLATPHQNPFGSLLALYLTIEGHGLHIRLAGKVSTDPATGQVTTTFANNPQFAVEDLKLHLFPGSFAALRTPAGCGTYTSTSSLTPWTAPDSGPPATPSDTYAITQGAGGAPCGAPANAPAFDAGSVQTTAGAYSPFVLDLSREDGTQQFSSISVSPPPGLLAKLAGTPACGDQALAAAATKSGAAEEASPSCPAASSIGTARVLVGAGPGPFSVPGNVYLAGPYKGAPVSLAIVTPAKAGPFDLGTVVVRTALKIDTATAQVTATSDPIPTILQGIPLDIRTVSLRLDRPSFTINPTSCDPMQVTGSLTSVLGSSAGLANQFQVGDCPSLGFKPTLKLALKGSVHRTANPSLQATLTARPGDANIASAQVKLPKAAFLDNRHIGTICTRPDFVAHTCPSGSIYGKATATSPLLGYEVAGPVYLRANPAHELPDLVADLRGPDTQPIEVELAGKTDSVNGALRNTFEAVPDVPVTKFSLTLFGGKKGLIEMSSGFCAKPQASLRFEAQNGKVYDTTPKVAGKCGKPHKKK